MFSKIRRLFLLILLTCASGYYNTAYADGSQVSNIIQLDFGAVVAGTVGLGATVTVTPQGVVTSSGVVSQSGGQNGSFTVSASEGSQQMYAAVASSGSLGVSISGCGSLLSLVTISNITLDSTGPKTSPGVFNYGATLSFTNVLSLTCFAQGCTSNAFYYNQGAPANSSNKDGTVQLCFNVNFSPQPLNLTHTSGRQLNFGRVCMPQSGTGYVTIATDGTRSVNNIPCAFAAGAADAFSVTGTANSIYNVTLPSSININNGANILTVDSFTPSCSRCSLDATGNGSFTVGGRVTIPAGVATGTYSGAYTVSVIY